MSSGVNETPLIAHLVKALRQEAAEATGGRLPSFAYLCRKYDVSLPTLRKAAHQLRDQGELTFSRGRTPRVPGPQPASPPPPVPALDRIITFVHERVTLGDWHVGQPLPKVLALARQFHASDHTVTTALTRLEHEGIIHRRGRSRYVGPAPTPVSADRWAPPRFILVVQSVWSVWQGICDSERTEKFAATFSDEAERLGIELLPVIGADGKSNKNRFYLSDERTILSYVAAHRDRYLGTLVCARKTSELDLHHWYKRLLDYRKPVVLFDSDLQGVLAEVRHPLFTRCSASDAAVAACAVEALVRAGHRRVGYPTAPAVEWESERLRHIREAAARSNSGLTIVPVPSTDRHPLSKDERTRVVERLRTISELPAADIAAKMNDILPIYDWVSPSMGRLLSDPDITAILTPNDKAARFVYEWLSALRVSLPDRFSLLSFDNYRTGKALPISSVDFGYGRLGYRAFHAILRLIPSARDPAGSIWAVPFVAHRGSLGPAYRA